MSKGLRAFIPLVYRASSRRRSCPRLRAFVLTFSSFAYTGSALADGPGASPFQESWFFSDAIKVRKLEGQPAPELNVATWAGEPTSIKLCRGRVVVLDLWAAWCYPCIRAMEFDMRIARDLAAQGVTLVAVHDSKRGWDKAQLEIANRQVKYSVGLDADDEKDNTAARYGLESWPTYVVIDRSGRVRAAGLVPEHVEDVVRELLKEPWSGEPAPSDPFPAEVYAGREARLADYRAIEGKPAPELSGAEWIGTPGPLAIKGDNATIVQFLTPANGIAMRQFEQLRKQQADLMKLGVRLVVVCDRRADWAAFKKTAEQGKWTIPILRDAEPSEGASPRFGANAGAFKPPTIPSTYVVDRDGTVRAAGIRAEMAVKVAALLLGVPEPTKEASKPPPAVASEPSAQPAK